jgi:hypothetical protein
MPIPHREGLAVDRELKPLCVGGGEARGQFKSSDPAQARFSRAFSAPGCGIASLYAAREAAYAGIASPPDMEWRPKIPHYVLVGQRAANGALCVEASESTIVRLTRSLAQLPSRRDLVRRRSPPVCFSYAEHVFGPKEVTSTTARSIGRSNRLWPMRTGSGSSRRAASTRKPTGAGMRS